MTPKGALAQTAGEGARMCGGFRVRTSPAGSAVNSVAVQWDHC